MTFGAERHGAARHRLTRWKRKRLRGIQPGWKRICITIDDGRELQNCDMELPNVGAARRAHTHLR
jgi:hypothetical protein